LHRSLSLLQGVRHARAQDNNSYYLQVTETWQTLSWPSLANISLSPRLYRLSCFLCASFFGWTPLQADCPFDLPTRTPISSCEVKLPEIHQSVSAQMSSYQQPTAYTEPEGTHVSPLLLWPRRLADLTTLASSFDLYFPTLPTQPSLFSISRR